MIKTKEEYRSILEQRLNEIFDERIDAVLAGKLAKHSEQQLEKHKATLGMLGVRASDPRVKKTEQQIKNRQSTQARLSKRA